ncbi:MAG: DNA polymerase III subunit beta [Deltaproteobacteria bacterium]|nr:DNA polymerase III subunit beta [Deltaproteobacteria bacterium]
MECIFNKGTLIQGLQLTQNIADKKNTMPILGNVMIKSHKEEVEIFATNLEVSIRTRIPAQIQQEGVLSLQAQKTYEVVRELPGSEVHLKGKENFWGEIESGKSFFTLAGLDPKDFPKLEVEQSDILFQIEASSLKHLIDKTTYATSTDEARYHLNGVFVELDYSKKKGMIKGVATDGHRLALVEEEIASEGPLHLEKGVLLPRKGLMEVKKAFTESEGKIEVGISKKMVFLRRDGMSISMRLISGEFPDYRQVIPKGGNRFLVLKKEPLIGALRRILLLSSDRYRGVRLNLTKQEAILSLHNPDIGEARENLPAEYTGDPLEMGFNTRYLLEAVLACDEENVQFDFKDELSPVLVQGPEHKKSLAVIMPMRF